MPYIDTFRELVLRTLKVSAASENYVLTGSAVVLVATLFGLCAFLAKVMYMLNLAEDPEEEDAPGFKAYVEMVNRDFSPEQQALKVQLAEKRKVITFLRAPITTTLNFLYVVLQFLANTLHALPRHRVTRFFVIPAFVLWLVGALIPGQHRQYTDLAEKVVEIIVWWVGLGILSSVGLGTGMHSGILFTFPHVMRVVQTANSCHHLGFDSLNDMWFRDRTLAFTCTPRPYPAGVDHIDFFQLVAKCLIPVFLWGAGTAIGEIPPYAVSYAAAKAGEKNAEWEEIEESLTDAAAAQQGGNKLTHLVNAMKVWMVKFLENYGFWGVVLMSAWPNAMFDLCGICCGHFLMPFWTFFFATFTGKALMKAPGQAAFFVTIFSEYHLTRVLTAIVSVSGRNDWKVAIQNQVHGIMEKFSKKPEDNVIAGGISVAQLWSGFVAALILYFVKNAIEEFAQGYQLDHDRTEVAREGYKSSSQNSSQKLASSTSSGSTMTTASTKPTAAKSPSNLARRSSRLRK